MDSLILHHDREKHPVTLSQVIQVAKNQARVELHPDTKALLEERRKQVVDFVRETKTQHYGFNRGFGHNVDISVDDQAAADLQRNLLLSHACGVGDPLPNDVVRAAMFLRAASLARGHSGVRAVLVERLLEMLNLDMVPVVPRYGSVGASGDLAPLSHLALPLMGEGEVEWKGKVVPAGEALQKAGLAPLSIEMKEGLALNNGAQVSTAIAVIAYHEMQNLLAHAALATALTAQVMKGSDTPFRADLHLLRPHPGARKVASWIWQLMQDSPIRESHRAYSKDEKIQDPYNLRCAAQILGACAELIDDARKTLEIEANAVTDNPVILELTDEKLEMLWKEKFDGSESAFSKQQLQEKIGQYIDIVSGGHFHGMPVAVRLYGFLEAMGIMSRLSNMRAARYVDEGRNEGLGADLIWYEEDEEKRKISSGMMIPEYVSASLTNYIWGAAMPAHLFSLSTDAGQEDHVSMSAGLAVRVLETLPRLREVLAIELASAAQARALREKRKDKQGEYHLSPACEQVITKIRETFPPVKDDRVLSDQLKGLAKVVKDGGLVRLASETLAEKYPNPQERFPSFGE